MKDFLNLKLLLKKELLFIVKKSYAFSRRLLAAIAAQTDTFCVFART